MRKCRYCGSKYEPVRPMQPCCDAFECKYKHAMRAADKAKEARAKAQRKKDAERKERIKTRSDWMKEAQAAVNAYVRARDAGMPCICCGKFPAGGDDINAWDAGHYRSVGSAPHLRFDAERNIFRQLKKCNRYGAGRAVDYRIGLIKRIGLEAVEALEADQTPRKYTIDELKAIKAEYARRARELKNNRVD